jgi:hypothetical protein
MDIRILGPGDEDLLIAAVELADEGPLTRERATAHLADASLVNVVAVEGGATVGFLYGHILRRFEAVSFFIYSVDVLESHKRGRARPAAGTRCSCSPTARTPRPWLSTPAPAGSSPSRTTW